MKFGFSLAGLSPRHYPAIAARAEQAGFESVWVPDHLVLAARLPDTYLYTDPVHRRWPPAARLGYRGSTTRRCSSARSHRLPSGSGSAPTSTSCHCATRWSRVTASLGSDLDAVRRARDLAVNRVIVGPGALRDRPTKEDYSDAMDRFADKVIANLSPEEVAGNAAS